MAETKNERKATMRQFAATSKKNNFIAAEPVVIAAEPVAAEPGETKPKAGETKETKAAERIPLMGSIREGLSKKQDGRDKLEIGQYFKVENKKPWKYYRKTSDKGAKKLKKEDYENGTIKKSIRNGLETLKINYYFKVKNGDEYKYYQKTSAKGTRPTTLAVIDETLNRKNALTTLADIKETIKETLVDVDIATNTTKDYMKNDITANSVKKHIQVQDMVAVDKNAIFSVTQLVNTSRIFRKHGSIVKLSWVKSITAYERLRSVLKYHERIDISEFIQIFDDIAVEIDEKSGTLFTPRTQQLHVATLKFQRRIEIGESVIHMNNFKIALYNFLMRKTRKNRGNKLKAIQKKREGLLLLVIACSIGLPTRKFTNAYGFFEIFAAKYTIVNDSNIIRTLLNLNGIYADPQAKEYGNKEYGNRALELWEIYKKEFPHFKSIDDDNDDTKTLYSYPTATELRYLVRRAETVIKNILYGIDLDEAVEVGTKVETLTEADTVEAENKPNVPALLLINSNVQTPKVEAAAKEVEAATTPKAEQGQGQLFSKKPLNFLMSI